MIAYYAIGDDSAETVPEPRNAGWIELTAPTEDEIRQISAQCTISVRTLHAVLDSQEDPRTAGLDPNDDIPGLIVLRYAQASQNNLGHREYQTHPLALILAGQQVVTVATAPLPPELHQAIPNWNDRDLHSKPEEFALHVMWCVLSGYVTAMNRINVEVDELQRELGNASRNKQLYQIMAMQKSLIYFESVLNNTMPILKDLRKGERFFTTASYDRALQNVMVEAHQASTMAGVTERILEQYNTTVSSIVSNNLNIIMKVLTSITIILTIPTVIGGLWGMNVPVPFEHQYWAFWGIIAATAVLCGISSYILWKHDYF